MPPRMTISTPAAGDAANISASASVAAGCRLASVASSNANTADSTDHEPPDEPGFGVNLAPDSSGRAAGLLATLAGSSKASGFEPRGFEWEL